MTERKKTRANARSMMAETSSLDTPRVEPVEPEIRSGISFMFRDALRRGVPQETQNEIQGRLDSGILLDCFISEWGFDVAYAMAEAFRAWLLANEKLLADACPDGVRYRGTYAVASGERRTSGRYRTLWTFRSFGAIQDMSSALGDPNSLLSRLLAEFNQFRDRDRAAPEVEWIMIPAASAHRF